MVRAFKIYMLLIISILCLELKGQSPEMNLKKEEILTHKIKSVNIILDSAGVRYQLPFDTIKTVEFNDRGETLKFIGFRSDFCHIRTKSIFELEEEKTTIIIQDSSFNCSLGKTSYKKNELFYTDEKLSLQKSYKKMRGGWILVDSILFEYNSFGKLKREEIYSGSINILLIKGEKFPTKNSETEYYYDNQGNLEERQDYRVSIDNTKKVKVREEKFYSKEGKEIVVLKREDYQTEEEVESKTEILYNTQNQKIKEIEYSSDGSVWFITEYYYDSSGLLIEEIGHKKGIEFAYKFKSLYEKFDE